ncbi:MAG: glycosyltransferase N-terminal domain-containing protein [Hyphomicrobium sp.]
MVMTPEQKRRYGKLAGRAAARLIGLVHRTSRVVFEPADARDRLARNNPAIVAAWHGQFMMLASERPEGVPFTAMVARHGDAEVIGEAMALVGVELIRGAGAGARAKDRGGAHALRAALAALDAGKSIVMTADVPPGPARVAGTGIVTLARLSGRPIVPAAVASSRYTSLDTWSRMTINLPWSTLAYVVGEPIFVPREAAPLEVEAKRKEVEVALNAITRRAYALAGADPARATPPGLVDPLAKPAAAGFRLKAYRAATTLLRPAAPLLLKMRERSGKEDAARRNERFGKASAARKPGPLVWVHAASVGEANAVLPLVEKLGETRSDLSFLLTTGTVTSAGIVARRLNGNGVHQYVPIDARDCVNAFLDHWRPDLAVFTESEIWPNLVLETADRGVPLVLVNARMSNKSYGRWRRRPTASQPIFNRFSLVVAQNEKLARRFGELGARNVIFAGNLKIDAPPPAVDAAESARLKQAVAGRPIVVAASTHPGEEEMVAGAHRRIAADVDGLLTVIAPRHPERGPAVAELLKGLGFRIAQRSLGEVPSVATEVYIADTIGELGMLYALAPVAFIGGSLADRGGQNPIEAVRLGAAVITGPHTANFRDAYRTLLRHKGVIEVRSVEELATAAAKLLREEEFRQHLRSGAEMGLQVLGGALDRTLEALEPYLPTDERLRRAS